MGIVNELMQDYEIGAVAKELYKVMEAAAELDNTLRGQTVAMMATRDELMVAVKYARELTLHAQSLGKGK